MTYGLVSAHCRQDCSKRVKKCKKINGWILLISQPNTNFLGCTGSQMHIFNRENDQSTYISRSKYSIYFAKKTGIARLTKLKFFHLQKSVALKKTIKQFFGSRAIHCVNAN